MWLDSWYKNVLHVKERDAEKIDLSAQQMCIDHDFFNSN
jgi:hypothetical protein